MWAFKYISRAPSAPRSDTVKSNTPPDTFFNFGCDGWGRGAPIIFDQRQKSRNHGVNGKPPRGQPTSPFDATRTDFDRDTSDKYSLVLNAGHEIERVVDAEGNSRC